MSSNKNMSKLIKSLNQNNNRWSTLRYNGPMFPESYRKLPDSVKVKYNNRTVKLNSRNTNNPFNISEEEAIFLYAQKYESDNFQVTQGKKYKREHIKYDRTFNNNFFEDFQKILGKDHMIQDFSKLDISDILRYLQKNRIKSPKRKNAQKDEEVKIFGYVVINNLAKIPCNYYIQPPAIYLGHGNNVYRGRIKKRIRPEDITINCSRPYPKCFVNGVESSWNQVITDPDSSWLASWNHPITGETAYLRLKRSSDPWVYTEDYNKFEKARELNKNISNIRRKYERDLKSSNPKVRELALAVYFLDKISIRPGGIEDESVGTQGLTTLKASNFSIRNDDVTVKFVGKSSIDYDRTVKFKKSALNVLKELLSNRDLIFPNTTPTILNNYLRSLMDGLTSKVFRTWKASSTLLLELSDYEFDEDDNLEYKKLIFEQSNIYVARELNHKKMTTNMDMVKKIQEKIKKCDKHSLQQVKLLVKKNEYEENLSLNTSKTNYIDPRIIVAWCKSNDVPIKCIISKTLLDRFEWAMDTESNFRW